MRISISAILIALLFLLGVGCTGAVAPTNETASAGGGSNDDDDAAGDDDDAAGDDDDDDAAGGDGGTILGTISGEDTDMTFSPKSAYAQMTGSVDAKMFMLMVSESEFKDTNFKDVDKYECTACPADGCEQGTSGEFYKSMSLTLMQGSVNADGFPASDDYEKADPDDFSAFDRSVSFSETATTIYKGYNDGSGVKFVTFETKPTAVGDTVKVVFDVKFDDSGSLAGYYKGTVETVVVKQPDYPTQPTCGTNEYAKPVYTE